MLLGKSIILATVTIALLCSGGIGFFRYRDMKLQQEKRRTTERGRPRSGRKNRNKAKLGKAFVAFVVLPCVFAIVSISALAVSIIQYNDENHVSGKQPLTSDINETELVTSPPVSSIQTIFPEFCLSEVKDSEMLALDQKLLDGADISAEQLERVAQEFISYREQFSNPASFFSYYPDLAADFPDGEEIEYAFDGVHSVEECNAQLRGAGQCMEKHKSKGELKQMAESCHHLAIRSGDAMNYTSRKEGDQKERLVWLYAEIAFASSMNEFIYDHPVGLDLSDWYYRVAQIFDYLGGIANTKELRLRMYFFSAVFLENAFKAWEETDFQTSSNHYGPEIGNLYVNMLCRVAVRRDSTNAEGFYNKIKQLEESFDEELLIDTGIADALADLESYQMWRERGG